MCYKFLNNVKVQQYAIKLGEEYCKSYPNLSIHQDLFEKMKIIIVYSCKLNQLDIVLFTSYPLLAQKCTHNNLIVGDSLFSDSENYYIYVINIFTVAVALQNINIILIKYSVLAIDKNKTEKISDITKFLRQNNKQELIHGNKEYRPWGYYENLIVCNGYKIKRIVVNPKGILSLQSHEFRAEQWTVINGIATVTVNDKIFNLDKHQSIYIPIRAKHRLENCHNQILEVLEIQLGEKLVEDDICRYDDKYGRV